MRKLPEETINILRSYMYLEISQVTKCMDNSLILVSCDGQLLLLNIKYILSYSV